MPTTTLPFWDLAIIAIYLVAMTLLGLWFSRGQKDLRGYFVGDRNVGWLLILLSIVATETSAVTFLSVPGLAYKSPGGNMTFLQLAFGYAIGRCIIAWFLLPRFMNGQLFSAYEILRERFNPSVQRTASGLFLITRTIADGLRIYLTALLLQYAGLKIEYSIGVVGIVTILYTYLGGMKAVIWTDLTQFVVQMVGALLAVFFIIQLLPGGVSELVEFGEAEKRFRIIQLPIDWTSDGHLLVGLIGGAVFSMASHGADQMMVQRYLCARNLRQARIALILSGCLVILQFAIFLLIGIGLFSLRQAGVFDPGEAKPDEVFGAFIVEKMPVGVVGLLIAAVLAAAMSTLSSSMNSSANVIVTDWYRPLNPNRSEQHYLRLSQILTGTCGLLQMAVALAASQMSGMGSIIKAVMAVAGFTSGLVLGLFLLGSMRIRVSSRSAIIGLLSGFATVLAVWLPSTWDKPILAWPWFAPIGAGTTVAAALLIHALFRHNHGYTATSPN